MISYRNAVDHVWLDSTSSIETRVEDSKVNLTEYRTEQYGTAALGGLQSFRPKTYSQLKPSMEGLGSDFGLHVSGHQLRVFSVEALGRRSRG